MECHESTRISFDTVDELREVLSGAVMGSEQIFWVVAWGSILAGDFLDKMRRYGRQVAEVGLGLE